MRVVAAGFRSGHRAHLRRPAFDAAGLGLLLALGVAVALALGTHPLPAPIMVAGGIALVAMLLLAVVRFDLAVGLGILILPIVRVEPAPVDGLLAIVIATAAVTNRLELRRVPLSMLAICGLFIALNLLSTMEAVDLARAASFEAITIYLVLFGLWTGGYVDRPGRARLIVRLYVFIAVVFAVLSSLALFVHFPGSAYLVTIDGQRAQGLFKDPNVYGPFLVPAALIVIQESLQPRLLRLNRPMQVFCFVALAAGVLFCYSRGAWLNLVVGVLVLTVVTALRRGGSRRAFAMVVVVVLALSGVAAAIAFSGSLGFLEQRARFQSYDTSRFGAQKVGIELAERHPLGIGPGQFELASPISAHSTYVRALTEEGVLGEATLVALLLGTLLIAGRNAVQGRDTHGIGSAPLLAAWCGLLANSLVIDTLHWRHLWLLAGLIWAGTHTPGLRSQLSSRAGRAAVR